MALKEIHHEVNSLETGRIDLVVQTLTKFSRANIRGLFDHNCITLNGKICTEAGTLVKPGFKIHMTFDPHRRYKELERFHSNKFQMVHEDRDLMVVDKAASVLTVPTLRGDKENLVEALRFYLKHKGDRRAVVSVVHRLDRDTSGLLVVGKSERIAQILKSQFEDRKPIREYQAIVAGALPNAKGSFRSYLETDEDLHQRSVPESKGGKLAITHYEVLNIYKDTSWVKVTLETGRRNQIRVHFSEAGHPVLGDSRYEPILARHRDWKYPRVALHAVKLGFDHPITGKKMVFESTPGIEFESFLNKATSIPA